MTKQSVVAGVFVIGMVAVSQPAGAQTIRACVTRAGAVRIVDAVEPCRATESPVEWNVAGPQGPQGPTGTSTVSVVDTAGVFVGPYADGGAVRMQKNRPVSLAVGPDGKFVIGGMYLGGVLYPTLDCSGQGYLTRRDGGNPGGLVREGFVLSDTDIIYAGDPVTNIKALSVLGSGGCTVLNPATFLMPMGPVVTAIDPGLPALVKPLRAIVP